MKKDYTDIVVVLDRSGSMSTVEQETKSGFNHFVKEQRKVKGEATLTLVQFDTVYEIVHKGVSIDWVPSLEFTPRGMTALLDAIGKAINETGARLSAMPEDSRPDKVIFVILTDGEENSSREFTRAQINQMITHQRDVYKWEFVFLGANQDAIKEATSIGIKAANAMNYSPTGVGTANAFLATTANTVSFRSGMTQDMAYSDEDRKEAMEQ